MSSRLVAVEDLQPGDVVTLWVKEFEFLTVTSVKLLSFFHVEVTFLELSFPQEQRLGTVYEVIVSLSYTKPAPSWQMT